MACLACGNQISANAAFCPQCGAGQSARPRTVTPQALGGEFCGNCGRTFGDGRSCRFCGQVEGLPNGIVLATAGRRLGEALLEALLSIVTLFIGWLIWSIIVWPRGQSPAKQILGLRAVMLETGRAAGFGRMFVREILGKTALWIIISATFGLGIVLYFWLLWDADRQELWDKLAGTIVVEDSRALTCD